jgi:hypothetical protein
MTTVAFATRALPPHSREVLMVESSEMHGLLMDAGTICKK